MIIDFYLVSVPNLFLLWFYRAMDMHRAVYTGWAKKRDQYVTPLSATAYVFKTPEPMKILIHHTEIR